MSWARKRCLHVRLPLISSPPPHPPSRYYLHWYNQTKPLSPRWRKKLTALPCRLRPLLCPLLSPHGTNFIKLTNACKQLAKGTIAI